MLKSLSVQNVALISNVEIEFDSGLNVLTGETGAGKSILIDSIGLLLGERSDRNMIRSGETQCKVVGCFSVEDNIKQQLQNYCAKYDLQTDDEILISRSYNIDGKSQIRFNGQSITLNILRDLTSILVDSYGQHENYTIFDSLNHLRILDAFCGIEKTIDFEEYKKNYILLKDINNQIHQFGGNDDERLQTIDYLNYQIAEIEQAKISNEEFENLEAEKKRLNNIGKIIAHTADAYNYINENTLYNISRSKSVLQQASSYDETLQSIVDRLDSVKIELSDIVDTIENYNQNSNFSEADQQRIEDRLNVYYNFFRKYGKTVDEVLIYLENVKNRCGNLINAKDRLDKLNIEKNTVLKTLFEYGKKLHATRQEGANLLSAKITENLVNLNMKNVNIKFNFEQVIDDEKFIYENGQDRVEILFSANAGEVEKPLNKIASGGEISRFMLALKSVIANVDKMPTMIFDEIDTGISGKTSEAVAKQMAVISSEHQVIVVTHSQHITAMADANYLIYKQEIDGKTYTKIKRLNEQEKISEVARFMSGSTISDIAVLNAKELIAEQDAFKQNLH